MYCRSACTGQSKARAGSASSRGSACRFTTWSRKGVVGCEPRICPPWAHSRAGASAENACWSPTLLIEANAVRSSVFIDRNFNSTDCKGSKGAVSRALRTNAKSQKGREGGLGGFNLLASLRNLTTRLCFPTDFPSTGSWWVEIAAT